MVLENISSEQFWINSVITAIIDVIFLAILIWRIKPAQFLELKWTLVVTAALLWSVYASFLVLVFWNTYYQYFYPSWFHSGGIFVFVPVVFGILALAFYWLAIHLPGNPIVTFCLLGGTEGLLEHLWGIYNFKILEIPFLQGTSPISILAFSFPEYVLYWCIVISIAALVQSGWQIWTRLRHVRTRIAESQKLER